MIVMLKSFCCSSATGSISPDLARTPADSCKSTFSCSCCPILGSTVTDDAAATCRVVLRATGAAAILWIPVTVASARPSILFATSTATAFATVHSTIADAADDCRAQSVDGGAQWNSVLQCRDTAAGTASRWHLLRTSRPAANKYCTTR